MPFRSGNRGVPLQYPIRLRSTNHGNKNKREENYE